MYEQLILHWHKLLAHLVCIRKQIYWHPWSCNQTSDAGVRSFLSLIRLASMQEVGLDTQDLISKLVRRVRVVQGIWSTFWVVGWASVLTIGSQAEIITILFSSKLPSLPYYDWRVAPLAAYIFVDRPLAPKVSSDKCILSSLPPPSPHPSSADHLCFLFLITVLLRKSCSGGPS